MFYGECTDSPTNPLFPFAHGLSYTRLSHGGLTVEGQEVTSPVRVGWT